MMFKIIKKIIILLLAVTYFMPGKIYSANENENNLLIIYDVYKEYAGETNNLNIVIKMSLTTGNNIEIRTIGNYTSEDLNKANGVIVLSNKDGSITKEQEEELYKQHKKIMWIGKNSTKQGSIPLDFENKKFLLDVKEKINKKFDVKNRGSKNCYLVLDQVYAFDDLNLIVEKVDYLYSKGIPFLINAMGVYENVDFEAMKRYTETLRYAVHKGGTVILGNPFLYDKGPTQTELIEKTGVAQDSFINYKVYPVALTIDEYYLYRNDRKEYLDKTSTIILDENENLGVLNLDKYSIKSFDNALFKVDVKSIDESSKKLSDVAIGVKSKYTMKEFIKYIDLCEEYGIDFNKPSNLTSELSFGNNIIKNNRKALTVNDSDVRGNNFISNEEIFTVIGEDIGEVEQKNKFDLKNINKVIFSVTITGGIIFIILFIGGLRRDKRKYFK